MVRIITVFLLLLTFFANYSLAQQNPDPGFLYLYQSGKTSDDCINDAISGLSRQWREWCVTRCSQNPNLGLKTFSFPDESAVPTYQPHLNASTGSYECQIKIDPAKVICECRTRRVFSTPTPTPTPAVISSEIESQVLSSFIDAILAE